MSDSTPPPSDLSTPANALTAARLFLLPVALYGLAAASHPLAVAAMVVAWLTDLADGYVARRMGPANPQGRALDTAVDFCFIFGLFIGFYVAGWIPAYQFLTLYGVKLVVVLLQLSTLAARRFQPLGTHLSKLAGALAYAYLLLLVGRLVLPPYAFLTGAQTGLFIALAAAVALNGAECLAGICRKSWGAGR
jgi:cardiolipin synthase